MRVYFYVLLFLTALLSSFSDFAEARILQRGDPVQVVAFCRTEAALAKLEPSLLGTDKASDEEYLRLMRDPEFDCVDFRVRGRRMSLTVKFLHVIRKVCVPSVGAKMFIVAVELPDGTLVYAWGPGDEVCPRLIFV